MSLNLKVLSDFSRLVSEHVFELLLLLSEHLDITLVVLNVIVDSTNHVFKLIKFGLETALGGH